MSKVKSKKPIKSKGVSRRNLLELLFAGYTAKHAANRYITRPIANAAKAGDLKFPTKRNSQSNKGK